MAKLKKLLKDFGFKSSEGEDRTKNTYEKAIKDGGGPNPDKDLTTKVGKPDEEGPEEKIVKIKTISKKTKKKKDGKT